MTSWGVALNYREKVVKIVNKPRILKMEILDEITNVEIGGNLKDGGEMKVLCFCDIIGGWLQLE